MKNKTVRFNRQSVEIVEKFMQIVREREEGRLYGKAKMRESFSQAAKYLFKSYVDKRHFTKRALFDVGIRGIDEVSEEILKIGTELNQTIKIIREGGEVSVEYEQLFERIDGLLDINQEILNNYEDTFSIDGEQV